jgi:hypothetical protein
MRRKDEARTGGVEGLGDMPGEAAIIADAGDYRQFALQIQWYHEFLELNKRDGLCKWSSKTVKYGQAP